MNVFYSPRSEERARLQLQKWFGGRFSLEEQTNHNMAPKNRREPIHDVFNTETHPRCPFLVSGSPSQICLIVSPRFRSRYLGDLLLITQDQGFTVEGFKQMMLHEKASSLFIPPQYVVWKRWHESGILRGNKLLQYLLFYKQGCNECNILNIM